jgi:putative oligomerization/nucleic acid binding protein
MTVGKISVTCWTIFVVMSVAFLPLGAAIYAIGLPHAAGIVLAIVVVAALWWGPFAYAMYLALVVVRNGDPRLLKRGVRGTAEVLSRKATNEVIQSGEFAWEAPRVYKYRLRVSIPGEAPYETDCRICAPGYSEGSTVQVAVAPHNHKRVTIDPGQSGHAIQGSRGGHRATATATYAAADDGASASPAAAHFGELEKLGQLHRQGILTDEEFAAEKARLLGG